MSNYTAAIKGYFQKLMREYLCSYGPKTSQFSESPVQEEKNVMCHMLWLNMCARAFTQCTQYQQSQVHPGAPGGRRRARWGWGLYRGTAPTAASGLFACLLPQHRCPISHETAEDTSQESHMHPDLVCNKQWEAHRNNWLEEASSLWEYYRGKHVHQFL